MINSSFGLFWDALVKHSVTLGKRVFNLLLITVCFSSTISISSFGSDSNLGSALDKIRARWARKKVVHHYCNYI